MTDKRQPPVQEQPKPAEGERVVTMEMPENMARAIFDHADRKPGIKPAKP